MAQAPALPVGFELPLEPRLPRIGSIDQVALSRAVVEGCGPGDLEAIGITASPCGGCRQWLYEFRVDRVTFPNRDGEVVSYTPAELLPDTWELD